MCVDVVKGTCVGKGRSGGNLCVCVWREPGGVERNCGSGGKWNLCACVWTYWREPVCVEGSGGN